MNLSLKKVLCLAAALWTALLMVLPVFAGGAKHDTYTAPEHTVVGYYAGWASYQGYTPEDIPAHLLTQVNYAFADINEKDNTIFLPYGAQDQKNLAALRALRQKNPHLKLLISVGGWDYSVHFSDIASTAARRRAFAENCVDFILTHRLDGIDLDWEYPVSGGVGGIVHRPQDKQNFTLLLREIRSALDRQSKKDGKTYYLTIAGGSSGSYLNQIEPKAVAEIVDHIFLMAYDLHGPWDAYADLNAPLYPPSETSPQYKSSVSGSVEAYLSRGVSADKLVLGMPLYGYRYQGVSSQGKGLYSRYASASSIAHHTLEESYLHNTVYQKHYHEEAKVPYLYGNQTFISYENERSIAAKTELAATYGLSGIGFWELSLDRNATLIEQACSTWSGEPFTDVKKSAWYYPAVQFVFQQQLMNGTSAHTFSPDRLMDRGMLAVILYRAENSPAAGRAPFPDVSKNAYYHDAIAWAYSNGLMYGYDSGRFAPDAPITREQFAAVLHRYAHYSGRDTQKRDSLRAYSDKANISAYAREAMAWAVAEGLIRGRAQDQLVPAGGTSRAESAAIFARLFQQD